MDGPEDRAWVRQLIPWPPEERHVNGATVGQDSEQARNSTSSVHWMVELLASIGPLRLSLCVRIGKDEEQP